jgi:hypothetical protein
MTWRAFITLVNIISQIVQRLGFIRLGRIPTARNGADAIPRSGTGNLICCQQPLQILAWTSAMTRFSVDALAPRQLDLPRIVIRAAR